jgi:DNA-binding NarL/FixJ family response regulator
MSKSLTKPLTKAKQEVLVYMLLGDSYAEMALKSDKTEQTLRTTASRIFKHFGIKTGTNGGGRHKIMSLFIDQQKLQAEIDIMMQ